MLYSSGTTGQPKGVLRALPEAEPGQALPVMEFVKAMFGFREGMTYLNPAPLYHSAPQASVSASMRMGCTTVVMEHFDAEQWLALVEKYRVTNCQMVPVMFGRLLRLPDRDQGQVRHLLAGVHRARGGTLPAPGQAGHDRLARAGHHRVLRRDRGERVHVLRLGPVASPPRHRRQGHPRRAADPRRGG